MSIVSLKANSAAAYFSRSKIPTVAVQPNRVTPSRRTSIARSSVRTPPAALIFTLGAACCRMSFKSSSVAPPLPYPVEVFYIVCAHLVADFTGFYDFFLAEITIFKNYLDENALFVSKRNYSP